MQENFNRRNYKMLGNMSADAQIEAFSDDFLGQYEGESIVTNYGNKKPYKIHGFNPEVDLKAMTFERVHEGKAEEISVFDYFQLAYNFKLTKVKQPVFIVKQGGKEIMIPSEACSFEGIPQEIKKNKMAMKEVFKSCLITPEERMNKSIQGIKTILKAAELSRWGLTIEASPTEVEAKILKQPKFSNQTFCTEDALRKNKVENPADFKAVSWTMAYQVERGYDGAESMFKAFSQAQSQLGIRIQMPELWIEYNREGDEKELAHRYQEYIRNIGGEKYKP
jgi:hypothetical protein